MSASLLFDPPVLPPETVLASSARRPDLSPATFAEFFAGIGLMRMGLERQGWQIRYANDIDQQKREMYRGHFPDADTHFSLKDIHRISAQEVPDVTLATASFPCNDLSLAGGRAGLAGKESSAFWGFIALLEGMKVLGRLPRLVLLENVAGFLTSHNGNDFCQALEALNQLGYSVDAFFLDAVRFTPQSRLRLFVVGIDDRRAATETRLPEGSALRPAALTRFIACHPHLPWRLRRLPEPPPAGLVKLETIVEALPDDAPGWWSEERNQYLFNQMSERHKAGLRLLMSQRKWTYATVFRRMRKGASMAELRADGIAGCLRTPRGGSGRQILVKAGYGAFRARLVTPREAARLMGADDFCITVPLNRALFGFGDAVCVPAISWIAQHYLTPVLHELPQLAQFAEASAQ